MKGDARVKKQKPDEAFVERPQEETQTGRARRISIRTDADGAIDYSQMSDAQKEMFFSTLSNDPEVLEKIAASVAGMDENGAAGVGPVTAEHIKKVLPYYSKAEARIICIVLAKKSKGLIKLPAEQAEKFYEFAPETIEELAPLGAQAINEDIIPHLPEWLVKFCEELGPSAKFFGGLAMHSFISTQELLKWLQSQPRTVEAEVTVPSAAGNEGAQP
jgi:hypothetical protein